jgi:hypothetical protein
MKTRVWLSYDLGVSGDYDSLYFWLDEHEALECGDSIATFLWKNTGDIKTEIKESLQKDIKFKKTRRVYVVFQKADGSYTGSFIIGKRKASPWEGYSLESSEDDE